MAVQRLDIRRLEVVIVLVLFMGLLFMSSSISIIQVIKSGNKNLNKNAAEVRNLPDDRGIGLVLQLVRLPATGVYRLALFDGLGLITYGRLFEIRDSALIWVDHKVCEEIILDRGTWQKIASRVDTLLNEYGGNHYLRTRLIVMDGYYYEGVLYNLASTGNPVSYFIMADTISRDLAEVIELVNRKITDTKCRFPVLVKHF